MRSTFSGIEIAKRSLFTQQMALTTTAHNMANADTKGYSRQVVNQVASRPMEAVGIMRSNIPGQIGTGVEFDSITRIREKFLDTQFYDEHQTLGDWSIREDTLEKLEAILNEPSDSGIRTVMGNFWNSWQELSNQPDNLTARAVVKESVLALTDSFNHISKQFADMSRDLTANIEVKVTQVNTIVEHVAVYNESIYRIEGLGNNANDLRDQRDLLLDELSKVVNIEYVEEDRGYTVTMGNVNLVEGYEANTGLTADDYASELNGGNLTGGEMHGMLVSRDDYLAEYQREFDNLMLSMAEGEVTVTMPSGSVMPEGAVYNDVTYTGAIEERTLIEDTDVTVNGLNGVHALGYVLSSDGIELGGPLFVTSDGSDTITARNVTLNPLIENSVEKLAASLRTYENANGEETVVRGNNTMALTIAGLRLENFNFNPSGAGDSVLDRGTVDEYFRAIIGQVGVQTEEAMRRSNNSVILTEQIDARRQSVSGVSLDEEMANMIKFQHAYNAAARGITTFDEMLDRVINNMGIVGR